MNFLLSTALIVYCTNSDISGTNWKLAQKCIFEIYILLQQYLIDY